MNGKSSFKRRLFCWLYIYYNYFAKTIKPSIAYFAKTVCGSILQDWIAPIWTTGIPIMVLEFCKNRRKVRFWKTSISLKRVVVVLRIFLSLFYFFMRTTNAKKVWREKVGKFNQIFGKLQKYFIRTTYGQKWPDTGCNWRKHSKMSHLLLK